MSRSRSEILLITTGGTIDAEPYDQTPENVAVRTESLIPQALEMLGVSEGVDIFHWLQKDSKQVSTVDLENMANIIRQDDRQYFIITHGTDAMPENSRQLKALLGGSGKKVIVTGAMTPLSHGRQSDGYDNLKVAVETLQNPLHLPDNVAVVMGGKLWRTAGLAKNFETKEFYYKEKKFAEEVMVSQKFPNRPFIPSKL